MKPTVVVIDDNEMIQMLLQSYLSSEYNVQAYSDASGALFAIDHGVHTDVIVTDLSMPGVDGQELLHKIKNDPKHSHIPVLILSGNEKSDVRINCLMDGADDFIQKPFHPEEVKIRIRRVLN